MHVQDSVLYSALDYSGPFIFGAGSVLPISRLPSRHSQKILIYKTLAVPGQTVHVKPLPLSALIVTLELCSSVCTCIPIGT